MADQADVGAFRRLDGAHAAVVGGVHVTHLEPGPLPGQTAGTHGRQAALVGEPRQRVGLVHELRQLRGPEELLDGRHHRPDVDQGLRGDGLDVLGRHALANHPLHPGQADPDLVLDELAHRADAPVGEVVLVVEAVPRLALGQVQQVAAGGQDLGPGQDALALGRALEVDPEQLLGPGDLRTELAVQLVTTDPGQVIALRIEEGVLEIDPSGLGRGRLAGPGPLVDLEEGLLLGGRQLALLLPLALEELEVADEALQEAPRRCTRGPRSSTNRLSRRLRATREPALMSLPGLASTSNSIHSPR